MKSMDSYAASGKWHENEKYIELDGEVYCKSCIQIVRNKALRSPRESFFHIL